MRLFLSRVLHPQMMGQSGYNFSTLADKLQKRQQQGQKEEFKKELEFMASKPSFTLLDFRQRAVDGIHKLKKGIKYKLSSGNEETEQSLILQRKIMNAMFDEELLDHESLTGEKKKEVAMVASVTVQEVNTVIKHYEHMSNLHAWVRDLKSRGEPMPSDQDEMLYKFRRDRPVKKSFIKFEMKRPNMSKKQRLQKMKWGMKKNV